MGTWSNPSRFCGVKSCFVLVVCCLLSACAKLDKPKATAGPEFSEVYKRLQAETKGQRWATSFAGEPVLSMTARDSRLSDFLRLLATETGASIVSDMSLDNQTVSLELTDQPLSVILSVVARRVGAELTKKGTVYYLGNLRSSDVGVLVRRAPRLPPEELKAAVEVLRSPLGKVVSYDGGVLVVGDRVEALQQMAEMLDRLDELPTVTWVVQLHVVELGERDLRTLGLDLEPALDLAVTFGAASSAAAGAVAGVARAAELKGGLSAVLQAEAESETMSIVADPLFLVADGTEATYSRGETYLLAKRATTQGGAVETTGFQQVRAGVDFSISCREVASECLRMRLDFASDEVVRLLDDGRPVVKGEQLHSEADMVSGGVYLMGSMRRQRERRGLLHWLRIGGSRETESTVLHVYARAYRIADGLTERSRPRPAAAGGATEAVTPVEAPKPSGASYP